MKDHEHKHPSKNGFMVTCYHHCRNVLAVPAFWIGITVSYPFEHLLWERVWPFNIIAQALGVF
jgi:hypothetical protein